MSRFEFLRDAGSSLLQSKRVWLIQFAGNPLLFAFFVGWLLLPVGTELHILLNGVVIVALVAVALILHAGTLNFYAEQNRNEHLLARFAFLRALRNIFAIAVCVGSVFVFWSLFDYSEHWQLTLPFYVRSLLPGFARSHLSVWWFQIVLDAIVLAIRWIVIPGLILPVIAEATNSGFRAFGKLGLEALKNSVKRASYWLVLLFAAVVGSLAPASLLDWTPEFRNPTLHLEAFSLIVRLSASYIVAVASWLLVCSIVGRFSRFGAAIGADAPGNSAA
jgi:hypothetical protein